MLEKQATIFLVATMVFFCVSYQSLRQPNTHGFYRFFVWEFILLLYVLNMPVWDHDLDSSNQLLAGYLFVLSLFLVLAGVIQLCLFGKPNQRRNDVPMLYFEKTTVLVQSGIYRYIRHPLYGSLFFLCWGLFFKDPSIRGVIIAVLASLYLIRTILEEEAECIRFFGESYRDYMKQSKRLLPFLW